MVTTDYGHWSVKTWFNPADYYGFVYQITNTVTGQSYIGKKNFFSVTTRKDGCRTITTKKESNWRRYRGSGEAVLCAISENPKDWTFTILSLHDTPESLRYREMELQFEMNVLREKTEDGSPAFYNRAIGHAVMKTVNDESDNEKKYNSLSKSAN